MWTEEHKDIIMSFLNGYKISELQKVYKKSYTYMDKLIRYAIKLAYRMENIEFRIIKGVDLRCYRGKYLIRTIKALEKYYGDIERKNRQQYDKAD